MLAHVPTANDSSCDQPRKSDNEKDSLPPMNNPTGAQCLSLTLSLSPARSKDANENHAALAEPLKQSLVCCFVFTPPSPLLPPP